MAIILEAEGPYRDHFHEKLVELLSDTPPPTSPRLIAPMPHKPILCLDFDGVLHSYTSGWQGADVIPGPPVPGALQFLAKAVEHFEVHIFSSRSGQPGGILSMYAWLSNWLGREGFSHSVARAVEFPTEKPPAMLTIDDRALTFTGRWPSIEELKAFKPWYQRYDAGMTSPEARQLDRALCSALNVKPIHDILIEVASECRRRIIEKGPSATKDDRHTNGELVEAAVWTLDARFELCPEGTMWPWPKTTQKQPHTPRQALIQACALLVAEIERLDRLDVRTTEQRG